MAALFHKMMEQLPGVQWDLAENALKSIASYLKPHCKQTVTGVQVKCSTSYSKVLCQNCKVLGHDTMAPVTFISPDLYT